MKPTHLIVSIARQVVEAYDQEKLFWSAPVSTAKRGTGSELNSYKTPLGNHAIKEKIGEDAPIGTIFKGRKPTGDLWTPSKPQEEDLILTRILWLEGLEDHNRNTFERYIYFHGTNHELTIGTPTSQGCIRLLNDDIISLFEMAEIGTKVAITEE